MVGDSRVTIPAYHAANPEFVCDISFIDGEHSLDAVQHDIRNMAKLASQNGEVILDDMDIEGRTFSKIGGITDDCVASADVRIAWTDAINSGIIRPGAIQL